MRNIKMHIFLHVIATIYKYHRDDY